MSAGRECAHAYPVGVTDSRGRIQGHVRVHILFLCGGKEMLLGMEMGIVVVSVISCEEESGGACLVFLVEGISW